MTQPTAITTAITNLKEAQERFNLQLAESADFFIEWFTELPGLTHAETAALDRLKQRYQYYAADGSITEGTVDVILVSPLLELLGLCDPPYKIRAEKYVQIEIEDGDRRLQGLIDVLVVQDQLWLVLIESKRFGFSVLQALPQTLAYLSAAPQSDRPVYGLITTGEDYLFVKLDGRSRQYDLSDKFTLTTRRDNQLYTVAQVIKRLMHASGSPETESNSYSKG
ncbi:type I restriction endonuclease subunit R [Thermoleptolyngbya sp. M55_K2018_002]|uniref:type I restriction endonuclease subunit R n=1 Tax=Thermoleptolyngbya sp. M55_K2018_002 TaxID=2747808 RepID=UPI0019E05D7B|nr:type I restriction endonuclease subunit R [Thermoleptolyngbya sp. M55_K2018_002]HIK40864.1 type I restriction endonuclease subunit R [Thermoleptolyngbya sp. M55_K2018_002]